MLQNPILQIVVAQHYYTEAVVFAFYTKCKQFQEIVYVSFFSCVLVVETFHCHFLSYNNFPPRFDFISSWLPLIHLSLRFFSADKTTQQNDNYAVTKALSKKNSVRDNNNEVISKYIFTKVSWDGSEYGIRLIKEKYKDNKEKFRQIPLCLSNWVKPSPFSYTGDDGLFFTSHPLSFLHKFFFLFQVFGPILKKWSDQNYTLFEPSTSCDFIWT